MDAINNADINSKKKRPARRKHLHITARASLCKMVKNRPVLWQRTHPQYKRNSARNAAWEEIGSIMSMSVKDIKGYWASFREQYRYNSGKLKKGLSADSDDEVESGAAQIEESECIEQEALQQWDLWEHYKFIVEENSTLKTKPPFLQRPCNKCHQVSPMESASSESTVHTSDVNSGLVDVDDSASSSGYNDINSILDVTLACEEEEDAVRCNINGKRPNTSHQANRSNASNYSHSFNNVPGSKQGQTAETTDVGLAIANAVNTFTSYMQRKETVNGNRAHHSALFYALGFIETQLEKLSEIKRQELLQKFMQMCFEAIRQQSSKQ